MTQTTKKLTFEDYLTLEAEDWVKLGLPEGRCEYRDGEIVELPPQSGINDDIANHLFFLLVSAGVPLSLVKPGKCEIEVPVLHPTDPRTRYPDLVLLRKEHLPLIEKRLTIQSAIPEPLLVVEIINPTQQSDEQTYEAKRKQYQKRGIPEFWLINSHKETIQVMELNEEKYLEIGTFQGQDPISSAALRKLNLELTAAVIFAAGR